jgi:AcrR family transcriptional regulator
MTPRPTASTPPRPLRRDAERNRQRILLAGRAAFAERGLEVTLDEIAQRAGVGVGTVYRRYSNKDELIDELYEDILAEIAAIAEAELAQDDPWKGLAGFLEQSLAMQASNRALKDIMTGGSHRGRERVARARERVSPLASELFERAKQSGRLRPDVTETDIARIVMMLDAVIDSTRTTEPDAWRRYLGIVLDGLRTRRNAPTDLTPVDPSQPEVGAAAGTITRRMDGPITHQQKTGTSTT